MTISNRQGSQEIVQPVITVDQTQSLCEIYEKHYPPGSPPGDDDATYNGRESFNKKIRLQKNCDITNMKVDAIVNAIQTDLSKPPVGLCQQMFYKGGPMLKQACMEYGTCPAGEAFLTEGYELPAKYVVHTAAPSPNCRLKYSERLEYLRQSYLSCLNIIKEQKFSSLGIPCLGTGGGGIRLSDGAKIAVTTVREWLEAHDNQTEHIIFCLFDDSQYEAVMKEMVRCFPTGKDAAGIDLEQLCTVSGTILNLPSWIQRTNIFCLKYSAKAKSQIQHHFHSLVNHCYQELSPQDSEINRYNDCAVFYLTSNRNHRCIILHSTSLSMIEIQILKLSRDNSGIDKQMKVKLNSVIKDYLETYFENVTPFEEHIRCDMSTWKSESGLWPVTTLRAAFALEEVPCDHGNDMANVHMINQQDLMSQWPPFNEVETDEAIGAEMSTFANEPVEHFESASFGGVINSVSQSKGSFSLHGREATPVSKEGEDATVCKVSGISNTNKFETECVRPKVYEECVRPKMYNIPNHVGNNNRSREKENISRKSSSSLSAMFFSLFKKGNDSLFSSQTNSRKQKLEVEQVDSQTELTNAADQTEFCEAFYASQQAKQTHASVSNKQVMQTHKRISERHVNKDFTHNTESSSSNSLSSYHNTIEEPSTEEFGNPSNGKLKDHLLKTEKSEPPVAKEANDNDCVSSSSCSMHSPDNETFLKDLLEITEELGCRHEELGIRLGLKHSIIQRHKGEYQHDLKMQGFHVLKSWFFRKKKQASLEILFDEMDQCDIDTSELRQKFNAKYICRCYSHSSR